MAEGGQGEEEIVQEVGKLSDEDRKLLDAFHQLKMDPQIEQAEDLAKFLRYFNKREEESKQETKPTLLTNIDVGPVKQEAKPTLLTNTDVGQAADRNHSGQQFRIGGQSYQFPKLPIFFGEENKGECKWDAFKYEVESVLSDGIFSEEQLMFGVRRALKGTAAEIVRNLGTHVTVREAMKKLDGTYGDIESRGSASKKFYTCTQGGDTVSAYCTRLEKHYTKCIEVGAITRGDDDILKQIMYEGLNSDLKVNAQYKYETIVGYDDFKVELRRLEATMKEPKARDQATHQVHAAQKIDKDDKSEMKEVKEMLKLMNEKIEQLQKEKESGSGSGQPMNVYYNRGYRRGRGQRYRGRGRGDYRPRRPLASSTFQGACYNCNEKGHMARDCPKQATGTKDLKE